jgi:hypothetical protein
MRQMLTQQVTILRYQTTKDAYNTPIGDDWVEVGTYPGRLSRDRRSMLIQKQPDDVVKEQYTLYLLPNADVQAGDLACVNGSRYRLAHPYALGGHHLEVTAEWEGPI